MLQSSAGTIRLHMLSILLAIPVPEGKPLLKADEGCITHPPARWDGCPAAH